MTNSLVLKSSVFYVQEVVSLFFLIFIFLLLECSSSSPLFFFSWHQDVPLFPPTNNSLVWRFSYLTMCVCCFSLYILWLSHLCFSVTSPKLHNLVFIFFTSFRSVSLSFSARSIQYPPSEAPRECLFICHVTNLQSPLDHSPVECDGDICT